MTCHDIFISYASEDRDQARQLATALEAHGWAVWWDRTIPAGRSFAEVIDKALADARCVVAMWSAKSVNKNWVLEEAQDGLDRRILVPVFIEKVIPPRGFRRIQAADLSDWRGAESSPAFQQFVGDIALLLGPSPAEKAGARSKAEDQGTQVTEEPKRKTAKAEAENEAEEQRAAEEQSKRKAEQEKRQPPEVVAKRKTKKKDGHRAGTEESESNATPHGAESIGEAPGPESIADQPSKKPKSTWLLIVVLGLSLSVGIAWILRPVLLDKPPNAEYPPVAGDFLSELRTQNPERLTDEQIAAGARRLGVDVAAIKAILWFQTGGAPGFSADGRPSINFEPHIFSRLTNGIYDEEPGGFSSQTFQPGTYSLSQKERWTRLSEAYARDATAALSATGWGVFRIMGLNYSACGFTSIEDFVRSQAVSEESQLDSFENFIRSKDLAALLAARDWASFARRFFGSDRFASDLERNYDAFASGRPPS